MKSCLCNNVNGLKGIMLSEISQTEKDKYPMISLIPEIQIHTHTHQTKEQTNKAHRYRELIGGSQRQRTGGGNKWINCLTVLFVV